MSPLGFKAREWAVLFLSGRGVHVTCSLRFTSGALLSDQQGSQAILVHIPLSRHWWDLKLGSFMLLLPHIVRPGR